MNQADPMHGEAMHGEPSRGEPTRGDVERWSVAAAGGALAAFGLLRGGLLGSIATVAGGALAVQGYRGRASNPLARAGLAEATVTIHAPRADVVAMWWDLPRLADAVPQIERIENLGDGASHWSVRLPGGVPLRWRARIVDTGDGQIAWRTEGPCTIEHQGEVHFTAAPGDRGTEVRVRMRWRDPAGGLVHRLLEQVGGLAGCSPSDELRRALEAVKQMLEAGEHATNAMRAGGAADAMHEPAPQPFVEPAY